MITLYENLRAIAYAPFYIAKARGYWAEAGVDVQIRLSPAPTETAEGVMAGRADISWGGPMRVMMHHDSDPACPLVCFGQIVARDPFVLIGARPNPAFRFADLAGLCVAVARAVPTPWMTFQDDLSRAGVSPDSFTEIPDVAMADAGFLLARGEVDVAQVLEPHASAAIAAGQAHEWHRFATRGDIGYTSFYTTRAYLEANRTACTALLRGIRPALTAVRTEPATTLASEIGPLFPETPHDVLTAALAAYTQSGLWPATPDLPPAAFIRLKAALLSGGLIAHDIPYDTLITDPEAP